MADRADLIRVAADVIDALGWSDLDLPRLLDKIEALSEERDPRA